ncbi:ATP synthase mitochondrial f1 complex assembly factor 2-like protein [Trifolium pratense]|uniref:ATP synthase mitochondrial f1 complex assembly factor 2-like protein n=1 Tax=Trifolium pratense TaxID=57577 RepID=A0A2K3P8P3_TRIPR|nr:ATP synthase mitochondrial f1 complex assembly factor 2-like protein [Trifolium pratense]
MAHSLIKNSIKSINPKFLSTLSCHQIVRHLSSAAAAAEEQSSSFTFSSEGDSIQMKTPAKTRKKPSSSVTMPMSFMTGAIVGKRFYKDVKTREADDGNGWTVMLDYRTLKTPAKRPLKLPTLSLAKAIAAEWEYQKPVAIECRLSVDSASDSDISTIGKIYNEPTWTVLPRITGSLPTIQVVDRSNAYKFNICNKLQIDGIRPFTMPLMRLACTAMERVPVTRPKIIENLVKKFNQDLVFCRAPDDDELTSLVRDRQIEKIDPMLRWLESEFGFKPVVYSSFFGGKQEDGLVMAIENRLKKTDDCELAAIDAIAASAQSLTIAIALVQGKLQIEEAIELIRLEEDLQVDRWGLVEGGHDIDIADTRVQISAPVVFLGLSRNI